jgi:hypothetical protein
LKKGSPKKIKGLLKSSKNSLIIFELPNPRDKKPNQRQ